MCTPLTVIVGTALFMHMLTVTAVGQAATAVFFLLSIGTLSISAAPFVQKTSCESMGLSGYKPHANMLSQVTQSGHSVLLNLVRIPSCITLSHNSLLYKR